MKSTPCLGSHSDWRPTPCHHRFCRSTTCHVPDSLGFLLTKSTTETNSRSPCVDSSSSECSTGKIKILIRSSTEQGHVTGMWHISTIFWHLGGRLIQFAVAGVHVAPSLCTPSLILARALPLLRSATILMQVVSDCSPFVFQKKCYKYPEIPRSIDSAHHFPSFSPRSKRPKKWQF